MSSNEQRSVIFMLDELAKNAGELKQLKIVIITDPTVDIAALSEAWHTAVNAGEDASVVLKGVSHIVLDGINGLAVINSNKLQIDGNRVTIG